MVVSFAAIEEKLQTRILMKLPNKELCRMRRTCSFLNQAVEDNKDEFSNRNMPGAIMWINGRSVTFATQLSSKATTIGMDDICLRRSSLSAIVFSEIHINSEDRLMNAKYMLERLKLSCEICFLPDKMSIQKAVETTDLICCRSMIRSKLKVFTQENIETLQTLTQAKNAMKMNIRVKCAIFKYLDIMNKFGFVRQEGQKLEKDFQDILWKLTETGDFGNLQQLSYERIDLDAITLPRTTPLWNSSSFPRDMLNVYAGPDNIDHLELPNATHCAIFSSHTYKDSSAPTGRIVDAMISFIKKDSLSVLCHVGSLLNRNTFSAKYYSQFASTEKDNWANFFNTFFMETNQD